MKKKFLFLFFILGSFYGFSEIKQPVKWKFKVVQKTLQEAELIFTATIDDGWHIYTQKDYGAFTPTAFTFESSPNCKLVGNTLQLSPLHADKMWKDANNITDPIAFEKTAVFKQKIKISSKEKFILKVGIDFGVCNDHECLPPDHIDFELNINAGSLAEGNTEENSNDIEPVLNPDSSNTAASVGEGAKPVAFRFISKKYSANEYELFIRASVDTGWFMSSAKDAKFPLKFNFTLPKGVELKGSTLYAEINDSTGLFGQSYKLVNDFRQRFVVASGDSTLMKKIKVEINFAATDGKTVFHSPEKIEETIDMSIAMMEVDPHANTSFFIIFLTAFLSGFAALLTPCVFPMIPMTVSFFLKRSKDRKKGIKNAMLYGFFIILIYVTLGLVVTAIFGSDSLNALSTNIWFNLFFFILLVVFAASFLGGFEIVLPSKWVNAADRGADKGGLIGIFFMAFTLALVSFSCTGPIVGTLLVQAAQQGGMGPFWGMLGFSLAIALPFTLFAIFPSWLNSMPSSGGWLNSVKVSLGFLELALALKFLSNADLVVKAHLLEREMFIALWIVIFALWGFYLLGKLKFSHDSDLPYVSVGRLSLSILVFTFVMYLIPGMWGAPLKWVNAFLPASTYAESPCGVGNLCPESDGLPEHAEYGPNQIPVFHEYKYALEYARKVKKPLVIDFTGHACVNCRRMENTVWPDEHIRGIMSHDVVVVSLYVDEKTSLPENERYVSETTEKKIVTVGNKWSDMQIVKYKSNTQPQYFMLDSYETVLNGSADYERHNTPDKFGSWLKQGIKQFELFNGSKELRPALSAVK